MRLHLFHFFSSLGWPRLCIVLGCILLSAVTTVAFMVPIMLACILLLLELGVPMIVFPCGACRWFGWLDPSLRARPPRDLRSSISSAVSRYLACCGKRWSYDSLMADYHSLSAIRGALESRYVSLVKASYLEKIHAEGKTISRRQDLPSSAFVPTSWVRIMMEVWFVMDFRHWMDYKHWTVLKIRKSNFNLSLWIFRIVFLTCFVVPVYFLLFFIEDWHLVEHGFGYKLSNGTHVITEEEFSNFQEECADSRARNTGKPYVPVSPHDACALLAGNWVAHNDTGYAISQAFQLSMFGVFLTWIVFELPKYVHYYHFLRFVVVSYMWLTPEHPDPNGEQLALALDILRRGADRPLSFVMVFWDFAGLYQAPRSDAQKVNFKRGIKMMNVFYGSIHTEVIMLTVAPAWSARVYENSGWCKFEQATATILKPADKLLNAGLVFEELQTRLASNAKETFRILENGREQSSASCSQSVTDLQFVPLVEGDFNEMIKTKQCTSGADIENILIPLYSKVYRACIRDVLRLDFSGKRWTDENLAQLALTLKDCESLVVLLLDNNPITEDGVVHMFQKAKSLRSEALHTLKVLSIRCDNIGVQVQHVYAACPSLLHVDFLPMGCAAIDSPVSQPTSIGNSIGAGGYEDHEASHEQNCAQKILVDLDESATSMGKSISKGANVHDEASHKEFPV